MNLTRFLLLFAALLVFSLNANAQGRSFHGPETIRGSGIDIDVVSAFEQAPPDGFVPIQVRIANQSGKTRIWSFVSTFGAGYSDERLVKYKTALTVPHGETRTFDVLAPVSRSGNFAYSTRRSLQISGYGIRPTNLHFGGSYRSSSMRLYTAAVAMSEELATRNWGQLQSQSPELWGTPFDLKLIPPDWRAFAGFDQVWLSADEWRKTDPAKRIALVDWAATGGVLYLARESGDTAPLPGLSDLADGEPLRRGFGEIRQHPTEQNDLDHASTLQEMNLNSGRDHRLRGGEQRLLENEYKRNDWPLLTKIEEVKLRKGLFIGFLVLFGIVIAPVNLFVFARGSRRHRLFWTTPALSLGASALIFLLILIQDGVGGRGHQLAIWTYLPNENKAVLVQEQVSRTALLTNRSFAMSSPTALSALETGAIPSIDSGTFRVSGQTYAGDWFRNRSVQGHVLKTVASTRSRIEVTAAADGAPTALSTFPFPLETLYYLDENGSWWHGQNLRSGESQRLEPSDGAAFTAAREAFSADAGALIKKRLLRLEAEPNHFYAFTTAADAAEATLPSIDWQTTTSLHTGPVVKQEGKN